MKKVITESLVEDLAKAGKYEIDISDGAIITPLAKDKIKLLGIKLIKNHNTGSSFLKFVSYTNVILASKNASANMLDSVRNLFFDVKKLTTFKIKNSFPDSLTELFKQISLSQTDLIIVITDDADETAVYANKFPKVKAVVCYDEFVVKKVKEKHNPNCIIFDTNILTEQKIISLLRIWQTIKPDEQKSLLFNKVIFEIEKYFINKE